MGVNLDKPQQWKADIARSGNPTPTPPTAPGPLAFQDQEYVLDILRRAGFSDCSANAERVYLFYPGRVEDVAYLASNIGPSARIMKEFNGSAEDVKEIGRRVADEFQQVAVDGGVRIPAFLNFFDAVKSPDRDRTPSITELAHLTGLAEMHPGSMAPSSAMGPGCSLTRG